MESCDENVPRAVTVTGLPSDSGSDGLVEHAVLHLLAVDLVGQGERPTRIVPERGGQPSWRVAFCVGLDVAFLRGAFFQGESKSVCVCSCCICARLAFEITIMYKTCILG